MLHYNLRLDDILGMAPLTVEYLMAGLMWSGRISVKTQEQQVKKQKDQWTRMVSALRGDGN